jgi:hypothetical protein
MEKLSYENILTNIKLTQLRYICYFKETLLYQDFLYGISLPGVARGSMVPRYLMFNVCVTYNVTSFLN